MPSKKKDATPCECRAYSVKVDGKFRTTECDAETPSTFAAGHDAKLKSLLIFAGVSDLAVTKKIASNGVVSMTALEAAAEHGFGEQVSGAMAKDAAIKAARARREADRKTAEAKRQQERIERKAKRDAKSAQLNQRRNLAKLQKEGKIEPGKVRARVGRQEFDGEVTADGLFHYSVSGQKVQTERYTVVALIAAA